MRILFLCGSIEPGRDGVGDYVRLLAKKLTENMHTISILALSTHHIMHEQYGIEVYDGTSVETLSIPAEYLGNKRNLLAKSFIEKVNPELISLQFVIFSYHKKGLPFRLGYDLKNIAPHARWQIMFHEIWIGLQLNASVKYRIWGFLQQQIIKSIVDKLKPVKVHTHTRLYKAALELLYPQVTILPLFSNIPKLTLRNKNADLKDSLRDKTIFSFVIFGTIHPGAPIIEFAQEAAEYAAINSTDLVFKFIGRNGKELSHWQTILEGNGFLCITIGECEEEQIACILDSANAGISSSSFLTLEKSGTVAAFRDFSLPVLCVAKYWESRISFHFSDELTGITNYHRGNFRKFMSERPIIYQPNTLDSIATRFMNDISSL